MKNYGTKNNELDVASVGDVTGCKVQELAGGGNIDADTDVFFANSVETASAELPQNAKHGHRILIKNLGGSTQFNVTSAAENIINYSSANSISSVNIGKHNTVFRFVKTKLRGDLWIVESYY